MNPRYLFSAVAIHATACVVAFMAVGGPGEAGANARESTLMKLDSGAQSNTQSNSTESSDAEWGSSLPLIEMPELPPRDYIEPGSKSESESVVESGAESGAELLARPD